MHRSRIFAVVTAIFGLAACSQGINTAQSLNPSLRVDAKQQNLLYVGAGSTISMYSYTDGKLYATFTPRGGVSSAVVSQAR